MIGVTIAIGFGALAKLREARNAPRPLPVRVKANKRTLQDLKNRTLARFVNHPDVLNRFFLIDRAETENDASMSKRTILIAACLLMASYGVWSLFVASRYQALCELSYWSASKSELKLCEERRGELGL